LTPTWVPRSFLHPGRRIKLHPDDYYASGADRGEIPLSPSAFTPALKTPVYVMQFRCQAFRQALVLRALENAPRNRG
jgi:hypothetical protein